MRRNQSYLESLSRGDCSIPPAAVINLGGGGGGGRGPTGPTGPTGPGGSEAANYQATATDDITTQSITDVVATGMTLTPPAGTYLVWFSGSTINGGVGLFTNIYSDGVKIESSEQSSNAITFTSGEGEIPFNCVAKVTVNGSQAIEGRWRATNGDTVDITMHQRNLTILKVA